MRTRGTREKRLLTETKRPLEGPRRAGLIENASRSVGHAHPELDGGNRAQLPDMENARDRLRPRPDRFPRPRVRRQAFRRGVLAGLLVAPMPVQPAPGHGDLRGTG